MNIGFFLYAAMIFICINSSLPAQEYYNNSISINSPWHVDFADINLDGIPDMVGVNGNSNSKVDIYLGDGKNSFTYQRSYDIGDGQYYGIILKDLNRDNIPDIIAMSYVSFVVLLSDQSNYNVALYKEGGGSLDAQQTPQIADINSDGNLDIVVGLDTYSYQSNGTFTLNFNLPISGRSMFIDINKDGQIDIISNDNSYQGKLDFYLGDGTGNFSHYHSIPGINIQLAMPYDFNSDGLVDIITRDFNNHFVIFFNEPNHQFSRTVSIPLTDPYYSTINMIDIDHDGKLDLVYSNDMNIRYRSINSDGSLEGEKTFVINNSSIRGVLFKNAIADDSADLIVMSGFGNTKIFYHQLSPECKVSVALNVDKNIVELCENEVFTFEANTEETNTIVWLFTPDNSGDSPELVSNQPSIVPAKTGFYKAIAFNANCSAQSKSVFVKINPTPEVFVPNIFTPNSDNYNDKFMVVSNQDVSLSVYNRYGKNIFSGSGNLGWNGANYPTGIYYWSVQYNNCNGHQEKLKGTVKLLN